MSKLTKHETLKQQIRKYYIQRNYEKAKDLEAELFYFYYGIVISN
jgi:hypothetical protein